MLITNTQKNVWRDFALKNIGDYHDLYVQSNKLILNWCISKLSKQIYWNIWTWSCSLFFSIWNSMASIFEKDWNRTWISNWYYMLKIKKMVKNGKNEMRGEICHEICR